MAGLGRIGTLAAADRIDAAEQPMRLAVGTGGEEQRAGGLRREAVAEAQPPRPSITSLRPRASLTVPRNTPLVGS